MCPVSFPVKPREDDIGLDDITAPYYEQEAFTSIWDALRWKHVRKRVPICFKKTLRNRYMVANLIYLGYTIALLVIDFHPSFISTSSESSEEESNVTISILEESNVTISILDEPIVNNEYVNNIYIGLAGVNLLVAFLYIIAWRGRSWLDVVLIPEYLNHIQAALYLWSAIWYSRQETLGGYYTMAVHRIELSASCVELCAAVGWMVSWYMTYTRTLGRGFSFDDPDTMAFLTLVINTLMYFVYNIQMNVHPEQYGTNLLYTYADIVGFIGSVYYILGTLRDENWFWYLPLSGQYGVAAGKIIIETKELPQFGKPHLRVTDLCIKRRKEKSEQVDKNMKSGVFSTHF